MDKFKDSNVTSFHDQGFTLVKSLFSTDEVAKLYHVAVNDDTISKKSFDRGDKSGMRTKLALWYSLDDSIYSKVARSRRIVEPVQKLLGGPTSHYHSKLMQKEPKVGGAWEWHQDYGYWYNNGFLYPQMLSVLTALTSSTVENGCLQVLSGSHKIGRINHVSSGEQAGADMEKVNVALERMELVYVTMEPGDTLFFHSNILHRSEANLSEKPRWSLISAYNLLSNQPYKDEHESTKTAINTVGDDAILEAKSEGISEQADFLIK